MQPATRPVIASQASRLLVVSDAAVSHLPRAAFPSLLHRDDLVIANDAATLPASLAGTHVPTRAPIEVRLAGRRFTWFAVGLVALMWFAIVFVLVSVQPEMTLAKVLRFNRLAIGSSLLLAWLGAFVGARLKERPSARRGTA